MFRTAYPFLTIMTVRSDNKMPSYYHISYTAPCLEFLLPLLWRHNGFDRVSNHQPRHCILSRLFRRRSKKTSKLRLTGLCRGIHRRPVNSPYKWPVTRKMFPFDDVIMTVRARIKWTRYVYIITCRFLRDYQSWYQDSLQEVSWPNCMCLV